MKPFASIRQDRNVGPAVVIVVAWHERLVPVTVVVPLEVPDHWRVRVRVVDAPRAAVPVLDGHIRPTVAVIVRGHGNLLGPAARLQNDVPAPEAVLGVVDEPGAAVELDREIGFAQAVVVGGNDAVLGRLAQRKAGPDFGNHGRRVGAGIGGRRARRGEWDRR
jgi:hypothetical protein